MVHSRTHASSLLVVVDLLQESYVLICLWWYVVIVDFDARDSPAGPGRWDCSGLELYCPNL